MPTPETAPDAYFHTERLLLESAKKAEGLLETGGKVHLGAPTHDAPGEGRIHLASKLLTRLGRTMFRSKILT
jgi:hypothetical protein